MYVSLTVHVVKSDANSFQFLHLVSEEKDTVQPRETVWQLCSKQDGIL